MARVLNKKRFHVGGTYIGRGSKWGNPFVIGKDGDRDEVILAHYEYLKTRPDLLLALDELKGQDLICFCKPLPCHGDVLLALANMETPEERAEFLGIAPQDYPR